MNDWQAAQNRRVLRAELLAIVEAQKGVLGALVRKMDVLEREIAALKRQVKTHRMTPEECQSLANKTGIPLTSLDGIVYRPECQA